MITTTTIAYFGIGVFVLMAIGIILTMIEFARLTEEPSLEKDEQQPEPVPQTFSRAEIRLVRTNDDAA